MESVVYEDDGSNGRKETKTTLEAYRYVLDNLKSESALGKGVLRRVDGGTWEKTVGRSWRIVYVAGHDPLPDGIVHLATTWVVHEYQNRGKGAGTPQGSWTTGR